MAETTLTFSRSMKGEFNSANFLEMPEMIILSEIPSTIKFISPKERRSPRFTPIEDLKGSQKNIVLPSEYGLLLIMVPFSASLVSNLILWGKFLLIKKGECVE